MSCRGVKKTCSEMQLIREGSTERNLTMTEAAKVLLPLLFIIMS